jgi:hypothetical protein
MKLGGYKQLGILPLQDHRGLLPEHREAVRVARIEGRTEFGDWIFEGHEGSDSAVMTCGDLLGGFHWPQASPEDRQMGAWFFVAPGLTTSASKKPQAAEDNGSTRTRDQQDAAEAPRTIKVGLSGDDWKLDERFDKGVLVTLPPGSPDIPKKTPIVVLASTNENEQNLLGIPVTSSNLIAVNNAGDPEIGTFVYDLTVEDEPDETRRAHVHSFWRVIQAAPEVGALAWQLTTADQDGIAGYGYVVDTGGAPSAGPVAPDPEEAPGQGEDKSGQTGAVTLVSDYLKELQDRIRGSKSTTPDQRTGTGAGEPGSPFSSSGRPIEPDPKDAPGGADAPAASNLIVASTTARQGGFIEVGENQDVHTIGRTVDGLPINAAHIHANALFKNEVGDGPLDFEVQAYEEPTVGGPFLAPVHLRWDPAMPHEWAKGVGPGKWRWTAEAFFYVPEDKRTTTQATTTPPPHLTETAPPFSQPPPKDCQTAVGGTRERGGQDAMTGGGGTGQPAVLNSATSGAPGGGIFANTGADTWTPPVSYPPGTGPGSEGTTTTTKPDGTGEPGTTGSDQEGPGTPWPNSGEPVPGEPGPGEPTRPRQKAGGGGAQGYTSVGRGGQGGGHYPPGGNIRDTDLPANSFSVFGGGSLPYATHQLLVSTGVLDAYGRPKAYPPPRVGDGDAAKKERSGGATSRTPTMLQTMAAGGGIKLDAYATAGGQTDFTAGGWIQNEVHLAANAGSVGGMTVVGAGDGSWESLANDGKPIEGGVVFGPAEITDPATLAAVLAGTYVHARSDVGLFYPEGLGSTYYGTPNQSLSSVGVQGTGVKLAASSTNGGMLFQPHADGVATTQQFAVNTTGTHHLAGARADFTDTADTYTASLRQFAGGFGLFDDTYDYFSTDSSNGNIEFHQDVTCQKLTADWVDPRGVEIEAVSTRPSEFTASNRGFWIDSDDDEAYYWNGTTDTAWGGGASTWLGLTDTAGSFGSQSYTPVRVNSATTALELGWNYTAKVHNNNASQSITTGGGLTSVTWSHEHWDNLGWHSTSSNTSRISPGAGTWRVGAKGTWDINGTGTRQMSITVNGTADAISAQAGNGGQFETQEVNGLVKTTAGQYIEIGVFQNSGTNRLFYPLYFTCEQVG